MMSSRILRDPLISGFFNQDDWDMIDLVNDAMQRRGFRGQQQPSGLKQVSDQGSMEKDLQGMNEGALSNVFAALPGTIGAQFPLISIDLLETDQNYLVHADVPGVEASDVDVSIVENKYLVIKAERKHSQEEATPKVHSIERSFGVSRRQIRLPVNADLENIQTKFQNGVLTLCIGKKETTEANIRKLEITSS